MHKHKLILIVTTLMVLPALSAMATPPDYMTARVEPMCSGGDSLSFMMFTTGNEGSHYIAANHWSLQMIDLAARTQQGKTLGSHAAIYINVIEEGDKPELTWGEPKNISITETLKEWGMQDCALYDSSKLWTPAPGRFNYQIVDQTLTVSWAGAKRTLKSALHIDPRGEYWNNEQRYTEAERPLPEHSFEVYDTEGGSIDFKSELILDTRVALLFDVNFETDNYVHIVGVDKKELDHAKSWLVNAAGLELHRKGEHENARYYFEKALGIESTNDTARYNLACAHSQLGNAPKAIHELQEMADTEGLKAKVKKDNDFDPIRKDPEFKKLLKTLK